MSSCTGLMGVPGRSRAAREMSWRMPGWLAACTKSAIKMPIETLYRVVFAERGIASK